MTRRLLSVAFLTMLAISGGALIPDPASAQVTSRAPVQVGHTAALGPSASRSSAPERLRIPAIRVNAPFTRLGLQRDRTLEVPSNAYTAGWFTGGPSPGQMGPAIVAGHVHWNGRSGVFANLGALRLDDRIFVTRKDGTSAVFRVTRVSRFDKSRFPSNLVYGNIDHRGLRLITCGGYDGSTHTYADNVVVFAMLVTSLR